MNNMNNIVRNFLRTKDAFHRDNPECIDWDSLMDYCVARNFQFDEVLKALEEKGYDYI